MEIVGMPAKSFFAFATLPVLYLVWAFYLWWKMGIDEKKEANVVETKGESSSL